VGLGELRRRSAQLAQRDVVRRVRALEELLVGERRRALGREPSGAWQRLAQHLEVPRERGRQGSVDRMAQAVTIREIGQRSADRDGGERSGEKQDADSASHKHLI
jgi:hypothetical protein